MFAAETVGPYLLIPLLLTGIPLCRAAGLRIATAVAASPAVIAGVVMVLSLVSPHAQGTAWQLAVWVMVGIMAIAGAALQWRRWRAGRLAPVAWPELPAIGVTLVLAALLISRSWDRMGGLQVPLERRDAVFHMNQIAGIVHGWGGVGPVGTTGWMVGSPGGGSFYPAAFHATAAAVPGPSVVVGNFLALLAIAVWMLGLVALMRELFEDLPISWFAAPFLSVLAISFPAISLFRHGQWPYGYSIALLPGAFALLWAALKTRSASQWILLGVSGLGLVGMQPASIIPLGLAGVFILVFAALNPATPARLRWLSGGLVAGCAAVAALLPRLAIVQSMARYERSEISASRLLSDALQWSHTDQWEYTGPPRSLILAIATLIGLVYLARRAPAFALTALSILLILTVSCHEGRWQRLIASPWYRDPERLEALFALFAIVAVAAVIGRVGAAILAPDIAAWQRAFAVVAAVLLVWPLVQIGPRLHSREYLIVAENYRPADGNTATVGARAYTPDDHRFWTGEAAGIVGDGEAVFAHPASGGVLLPATEGVRAVPAVSLLQQAAQGARDLEAAFEFESELTDDSSACQFVRENNIRYVYYDTGFGTRFGSVTFAEEGVARYGDLIAGSSGGRALYRLTRCW